MLELGFKPVTASENLFVEPRIFSELFPGNSRVGVGDLGALNVLKTWKTFSPHSRWLQVLTLGRKHWITSSLIHICSRVSRAAAWRSLLIIKDSFRGLTSRTKRTLWIKTTKFRVFLRHLKKPRHFLFSTLDIRLISGFWTMISRLCLTRICWVILPQHAASHSERWRQTLLFLHYLEHTTKLPWSAALGTKTTDLCLQ